MDLMKDSIFDVRIVKLDEEQGDPTAKKMKRAADAKDRCDATYEMTISNKRNGKAVSKEMFFISDDDLLSQTNMSFRLKSLCSQFGSFKMRKVTHAQTAKPKGKVSLLLIRFFSSPPSDS